MVKGAGIPNWWWDIDWVGSPEFASLILSRSSQMTQPHGSRAPASLRRRTSGPEEVLRMSRPFLGLATVKRLLDTVRRSRRQRETSPSFQVERLEDRVLLAVTDGAPTDDSLPGTQPDGSSQAVVSREIDTDHRDSLDRWTVDLLAKAALDRWTEVGLNAEQIAALGQVEYRVADLDVGKLGSAEGWTITLDIDAAGQGWFVDDTPNADEEFAPTSSVSRLQASTSPAVGRIDVLSILMHEQGHVLGLPDIYASHASTDLMHGHFSAGERRLPVSGQASEARVGSLEGIAYAGLPPSGTDDSYSTTTDTPLVVPAAGLLANDTDPENDSLAAMPTYGQSTLGANVTINTDGSFVYDATGLTTEAEAKSGAWNDTFTYTLSDGAVPVAGFDLEVRSATTLTSFETLFVETASVTFEAVVTLTELTSNQIIFETGGGSGLGLVLNGDDLIFRVLNNGPVAEVSTTLTAADLFQPLHIIASFDVNGVGTAQLWVNGSSVGSDEASAELADWSGADGAGFGMGGGANLGGFGGGFTFPSGTYGNLTGTAHLFRVYEDKVFTSAEVTQNFLASQAGTDTATVTVTLSAVDDTPPAANDYVDGAIARETFDLATLNWTLPQNDGVVPGALLNYEAHVVPNPNDARWQNTGAVNPTNGSDDWQLGSGVTHVQATSSHQGITSAYHFDGSATSLGPIDFSTGAIATVTADAPQDLNIDTNANATIELWFRPETLSGGNQNLWETGGGMGAGIVLQNNTLQVRLAPSGASVTYNLATDPLGLLPGGDATADFIQVVASLNLVNGIMSVYVNGARVGTAANIGTDWDGGDGMGLGFHGGDNQGGFGGGESGFTENFAGDIAIFRLYGSALGDAHVLQNFKAVSQGVDIENDPFATVAETVSSASGATVTIRSDGTFLYDATSTAAFDSLLVRQYATDTFNYRITDGNATSTASVTIRVQGANDAVDDTLGFSSEDEPQIFAADAFLANDEIAGPFLEYDSRVETDGVWNNLGSAGSNFDSNLGGASLVAVTSTRFAGITQAYQLNGVDHGGTLPDVQPATPNDPSNDSTTFEIVFKPDTLATGLQVLLEFGGSGNGMGIFYDADTQEVLTILDGGDESTTPIPVLQVRGAIDPTDFNQIVLVYTQNGASGDTAELYVNGLLVQTDTTTSDDDGTELENSGANVDDWSGGDSGGIGRVSNTIATSIASTPFSGQFARISLHDRPFAAADVTDAFNRLSSPLQRIISVSETSALGVPVSLNSDGTVSYTPAAGHFDHIPLGVTVADSFTYTIDNGFGGLSSATATLQIRGENNAVNATDDAFTVNEDDAAANLGSVTSADNGSGADTDVDTTTTPDTIIVVAVNDSNAAVGSNVSTNGGGLAQVQQDGSLTYDPNGGFEHLASGDSEVDTFTYLAADQNALTNGLEFHTAFGESAAGTSDVALDLSGQGRSGTFLGNATVTASDSPLGGDMLVLDGSGDFVRLEGYTGVTGNAARTVSAWIKTTSTNVAVVSYGANVAGQKFVFRVQSDNGQAGAIRVEVNGGYIVGSTVVNDGGWHHVAFTYDPTDGNGIQNGNLYVDGQLESLSAAQNVVMNTASSQDVHIGTDPFATGRDLAGTIDDVAIWSRALTATEIEQLYNTAQHHGLSFQTSSVGTVSVTVQGANDPPVAVDDDYTVSNPTDEDTPLTIPADGVFANDIDADTPDLNIATHDFTSAYGASVVVNSDGSFTYDPTGSAELQDLDEGQWVTDTFTYTVTDATTPPDGLMRVQLLTASGTVPGTTTANWLNVYNALDGGAGPTGTIAGYNITNNVIDTEVSFDYAGDAGNFGTNHAIGSINGTGPGGSGGPFSPSGQGGSNYSIRATTYLRFSVGGTYTLAMGSDDGRRISLTAADLTSGSPFNGFASRGGQTNGSFTAGDSVIGYSGGTGHDWTAGVFTVAAGDVLMLDAFYYEGSGGDSGEIAIASGSYGDFTNTTDFTLLREGVFGIQLDSTDPARFNVPVSTATVSILVNGVNDPIDAVNDVYQTDQNTPVTGQNVFANDTDADNRAAVVSGVQPTPDDNDPWTVTAVNGNSAAVATQVLLPSGALLSMNADGTFTYDPNGAFDDLGASERATDTFTYTATDDRGDGTAATQDTAQVQIRISGRNDAPTANDDTATSPNYTVNENDTLAVPADTGVLANDTDPDANDANYVASVDTTNTEGVVSADQTNGVDGGLLGTFFDLDNDLPGSENDIRMSARTWLLEAPAPGELFILQSLYRLGMAPTVTNAIVPQLNFPSTNGEAFPGVAEALDTDQIAAIFEGRIQISTGGTYTFAINSDDGAVLYINGQLVVNRNLNTGFSGSPTTGSITLAAGIHDIAIGYYEGGTDAGIITSYSGPDTGSTLTVIPSSVLLNDVATSGTFVTGGLRGTFFDTNNTIGGVNNSNDFAGNAGPYLLYGIPGGAQLLLEALPSEANDTDIFTPFIDFGAGTEISTGTGDVLNRGGTNDNAYGGLLAAAGASVDADQVAALFRGYLHVPQSGDYTFTLASDDGAIVRVGGTTVVSRSSDSGVATGTPITLTAGFHAILIAHFEGTGGQRLQVSWSGPGLSGTQVLGPDHLSTVASPGGDGSFQYDPNGQFDHLGQGETATDTFTYTISDFAGQTSTATATVTIIGQNDQAILLGGAAAQVVNEGTALTIQDIIRWSDLDHSDVHAVTVDWGDGTPIETLAASGINLDVAGLTNLGDPSTGPTANQFSIDASHIFADDGNYTVTVTVTSANDDPIQHTLQVSVNNLPPTAVDDGLPFKTVWQLGIDNGNQGEFVQESANSDEHYYFAGSYPSRADGNADLNPTANEPFNTFDRALVNSDPRNFIHFNLSPDQLNDNFRLIVDVIQSNVPAGGFDFEVLFNGQSIFTQNITANGIYTTPVFNGVDVSAITGDNIIEIRRNDTNGGWIQFDRLTLQAEPNYVASEDVVLNIPAADGVLVNDTDPAGASDPLVVTQIQSTGSLTALSNLGATVTMQADGSFTYDARTSAYLQTLVEGETVQDQFTYTISEGDGGFDSAVVTIVVQGQGGIEIHLDHDFPLAFAGDPAGASPDVVSVGLNAGNLDISVNGSLLRSVPAAALGNGFAPHNITFVGSADADQLVVGDLGTNLFGDFTIDSAGGMDDVRFNSTVTLLGNISVTSETTYLAGNVTTGVDQDYLSDLVLETSLTLLAENVVLGGAVSLAGHTLTVDISGTSSSSAGGISGTGGLIKQGIGTLLLANSGAGNNSYTGLTHVQAGILQVGGGFGGDAGVRGNITIDSGATFELIQSNIIVNSSDVIVNGEFDMSDVADAIGNIQGSGEINLAGGTLTLDEIGATHVFTGNLIGNGNLAIRGNASTAGQLVLSGGTSTLGSFLVGDGTVVITDDATVTVNGTLRVGTNRTTEIGGIDGGNTTGILNFESGNLTARHIELGNRLSNTVTATINQSGGTVNTTVVGADNAGIRIGHWPNTLASYNLSGGELLIGAGADLAIAIDGAGTFHQTGGLARTNRLVVNARSAAGSGSANIEGGTLEVGAGGIVTAGGPASLTFGGQGAVVRATASFTSSLNATLLGTTTNAVTFDTNGFDIGLSGLLDGSGGLNKQGTGTLTLSGDNIYSGSTDVAAGTLLIEGTMTVMSPIAGYRADYQGGAPASGWQYLWNANGAVTDRANFVPLLASPNGNYDVDGVNGLPGPAPGSYINLSANGGHPGQASGQGGNTVDRYVIAAYTVSQDGTYAVGDGLLDPAGTAGDGNDLRIFVWSNGTLTEVFSTAVDDSATSFSVLLGQLSAGDVIYVASGTDGLGGGNNDGNDGFNWDFSILQSISTSMINVRSGATLGGSGSTNFGIVVDGSMSPGTPGVNGGVGTFTATDDVTIDGQLVMQVDGDTSADLLQVTGEVNLGPTSTLLLSDTVNPSFGTTIVLINNDGNDAVIGTFAGLAEGATVVDDDGNEYTISYSGGDGNDVVLIVGTAETHVSLVGSTLRIEDINTETADDITITFDGGTNEYVITDPNVVISTSGLLPGQVTRPDAHTVRVDASLIDGIEVVTANPSAAGATDLVTIVSLPTALAGNLDVSAETIQLNTSVLAGGDITFQGTTVLSQTTTLDAQNVALNGAVQLGSNDLTIVVSGTSGASTGGISGTGSLIKQGTGTFTLNGTGAGNNSYTGLTHIQAGQLNVGGGFGGDGGIRGDITIDAGATFVLTQANIIINSSDVTVNGTLNMSGLSDALGNLQGSGNIVNNSNGTGIVLDDLSTTHTFSGNISGNGGLLVRGSIASSGTQVLSVGTFALSTLRIGHGALTITQDATVNVSGGTIVGTNIASQIGGVLATNMVSTLTVESGSLRTQYIEAGNRQAATVTAFINQTGGRVETTGATAENNGIRLGHWPSTDVTYSLSGGELVVGDNRDLSTATDGTGRFTQTGGIARANRVVVNKRTGAAGNGTFSVLGGTFYLGSGGIITDTTTAPSVVNLGGQGGTIVATASWASSLDMSLSGSGADAISFDTAGFDVQLTGNLTGAGGLNKIGLGTLLISGANSYAGDTQLAVGTLQLDAVHTGGGLYTLAAGTVLSGAGSTTAAIQSLGATISPELTAVDDLGTGNLTLDGGSILDIQIDGIAAGSQHDQLIVSGAVNLADASLQLALRYIPNLGDQIVLLDNDGAESVVGEFTGLPEGFVVNLTSSIDGNVYTFAISYTGGDGNDIVLESFGIVETSVEFDTNGNLVITDVNGGVTADRLTVNIINGAYVISDSSVALSTSIAAATRPNARTVVVPVSQVAGGLVINLLAGGDQLDLQAVHAGPGALLDLGTGDDSVRLGSVSGSLDTILGPVTIQGGLGNETVLLDDSNETLANGYTLGESSVGRNSLENLLTFSDVESYTLQAGSGSDTILVTSLGSISANVLAGGGADQVRIHATGEASLLSIDTGVGDDLVSLGDDNGLLNAIAGVVTLNGNAGLDSLTINDSGDSANNTGTLTQNSLSGFGLNLLGYEQFEELDLQLGSGSDRLLVTSTSPTIQTRVDLGAGDDTLAIGVDNGSPVVLTTSDSQGSDTLDFSGSSAVVIDLDATTPQTVTARGDTLTTLQPFENFVGSPESDVIRVDPLDAPRLIQGNSPGAAGGRGLDGNFAMGDTLFVDLQSNTAAIGRPSDGSVTVFRDGTSPFAPISFTNIEIITLENVLNLNGLPQSRLISTLASGGSVNNSAIPTNDEQLIIVADGGNAPDPLDLFNARGADEPGADGNLAVFVLKLVRIVNGQPVETGRTVNGSTVAEAVRKLRDLELPEGEYQLAVSVGMVTVDVPLPQPQDAESGYSDSEAEAIESAILDELEEAGLDLDEIASDGTVTGAAMLAAATLLALRGTRTVGGRVTSWADDVERLMSRFSK
jgi:autotransporter-associated beta strand protein/VCBS repeat-containing protein